MEPAQGYQMGVKINGDFKVEVVEPADWAGTVLTCPPRIANGLPSDGTVSQVMVDTQNAAVTSLVSNPAEEGREQRRADAEERAVVVMRVANQMGPYLTVEDSARSHLVDDRAAEADALLKAYFADQNAYWVMAAHDDDSFTVGIDPPAADYRKPDDTENNWTIAGRIEWDVQMGDNSYPSGMHIWHFGPSQGAY